MVTIQQQISLSERRRQRALSLQPQTSSTVPQVYDESTTQGQILSTRQQLSQARTPLQQFKSQYLFPKKRERAFTDRRARAQVVQAGQGVAEQLGQIQQQEQTFEREVATKAPEYALQAQKQQALMEAKQSIQARIDDLQARIQKRLEYIERKRQDRSDKNRREDIERAEDDISEYRAELNEYQKGLGLGEDNLIKQHFSGYIQNKAQYERDYIQARNQQQADFRKMKKSEDFSKTLEDLKKSGINIGSNPSLSQFESAINKYNQDVGYKNQLLKLAEQKGGIQFLSPQQKKDLGVDTKGFEYYKTPQKGWVDPNTGLVIEQSLRDDIARSLGYQPVEISAYNPLNGEYIHTPAITQAQKKMYELFVDKPQVAKAFYGFDIVQSEKIPDEVISYGSSIVQPKQDFNLLQFSNPSGGTFDALSKVKPYTPKELEIMEYQKDPLKFYNKYGYDVNENGLRAYGGSAFGIINLGPRITFKDRDGRVSFRALGRSYLENIKDIEATKSAFNVANIAMLPRTIATFGVAKSLGFTFADKIKAPIEYAYSKTYQPKSFLGQFGKASLTSYVVLSSPTLSSAYGYSFLKGVVKDPRAIYEGVVQQAKERPGELLGFLVGGKLLQRGVGYAEYKLRGGVETKKVNLPGYGEVIVQNIPKFKQVVWIKGAFATSEKVKIMTQINSLLGKGNRVFVQVSPQGIPMQVFSATKNLGFKVSQLQNPMRGLYQAPPFQFLKKYQSLVKTEAGALSYYAGQFKRDSILPNPLKAIKTLLTKDTITKQRPFQYLERTGTGVQTPTWIKTLTKSLLENKGIPQKYQVTINKYFKVFLDKPIEFNGKTYMGLDKLQLVNKLNLRGRGSGVKLKVYAALLEYQNLNKLRLVSGAENLAGILPYGGESQIVTALGVKYFPKSAKDLRVGVKPTITSKIIDFVTGTKRGQYVSRIDGQLVEIMPVRSFPGRIKAKVKLPKVSKAESLSFDNLLSNIKLTKKSVVGDFIRRRTTGEYASPPRPFPLTQRASEVRRIDRPFISGNPLIVVRDEIRRPEQRRPLDRIIPRSPVRSTRDRPTQRAMPELRRVDVREPRRDLLIPRRPEVPRRSEPRPLQRPIQNQLIRTLTIRPQPKKKKQLEKKPVRRPQRYNLLPTITQQIYGIRRKGGKLKESRGFEILRV